MLKGGLFPPPESKINLTVIIVSILFSKFSTVLSSKANKDDSFINSIGLRA